MDLGVTRMVETRIAPRHRVNKPAKIEYGGDKVACTIRDISVTGAALEISGIDRIPAEFTLIVPEDRLKLPCRVVWRREFRIGVTFN
jgi:PilZ domain